MRRFKWFEVAALTLLFSALAHATTPWNDPTPRTLMYCNFDNGTLGAGCPLSVQNVQYGTGKFGGGITLNKGNGQQITMLIGPQDLMDPARGTLSFWIRFDSEQTSGPTEILSVFPGPPNLSLSFGIGYPAGSVSVATATIILTNNNAGGFTLTSSTFNVQVGQDWHQVVWTWEGNDHLLYVDGQQVGEMEANGLMALEQMASFRVGTAAGGTQSLSFDDLIVYNFPLTLTQVQQAYAAVTAGPLATLGAGAPAAMTVDWGPGVQKALVNFDVGNAWAVSVASAAINIENGANVVVAHTGGILPHRGLGEALVSIPMMPPDTYQAVITILDVNGNTLGQLTSDPYVLPNYPWLNQSIGQTTVVQPPWTPIANSGNDFSVWGRTYQLSGGFGLPQQIISQGQTLLSSPVSLEIYDANKSLISLAPTGLTVTSVTGDKAQWQGQASGGGINVSVSGTLEYDGMVLLTLHLAAAAPVTVSAMNLQTVMPGVRAMYAFTTSDNAYWWYPYRGIVPSGPGVFLTNLQQAGSSHFLPLVDFTDDDRGLEWFADSPSGWQINTAQSIQQLIRDPDGDVRLTNLLANQTFVLTPNAPIDIVFGYEALPIKPLPANWRSSRIGDGPATEPPNNFYVNWRWPDASVPVDIPSYELTAPNIAAYASSLASERTAGWKVANYSDQHVTIPSGGIDWSQLDILNPENRNDGWTAVPTLGNTKYWTYQFQQMVSGNAADSIYIDEPEPQINSSLLSGAGYFLPDGISTAPGFSLIQMREQFKRMRQVLIDNGRSPLLWLHTTNGIYPHAYAYADIASDGEAAPYIYAAACHGDYIDAWGGSYYTAWLRVVGRAQKYGMTPAFLIYIYDAFNGTPSETANPPSDLYRIWRSIFGLFGLYDIPTIASTYWDLNAQWRNWFGISNPGVQFTGYWQPGQTAVVTGNSQVLSSYYTQPGPPASALVYITNLFDAPFSGSVSINASKLGLNPALTHVYTVETRTSIPYVNGAVPLTIAKHDFEMLLLREEPATANPTAPPERKNVSIFGTLPSGTTRVSLSLQTDKPSTCRWSALSAQSYAVMTSSFSTSDGLTHQTALTGFRDGTDAYYYVKCMDMQGHANPDDLILYYVVQNSASACAGVPDAPPSVGMTSPVNLSSATIPTALVLIATAAASTANDGWVSKVEFYSDSNKVGESDAAPFQYTWPLVYGGTYTIHAVAYDNLGTSAPSSNVTLFVNGPPPPQSGAPIQTNFFVPKVYPNPWRSDKYAGHPFITFGGVTTGTTIKIFTVSAHEVKELHTNGPSIPWDLTNNAGDKVASGIYLYVITDSQGDNVRGELVVIK